MLFTGIGQHLRNADSVVRKWLLSPEGTSTAWIEETGTDLLICMCDGITDIRIKYKHCFPFDVYMWKTSCEMSKLINL